MIYAKHPSYSVNYHSDCIAKRRSLLKSILDACGRPDDPEDSYLFTNRGYIPAIREASCAEDAESIINLLRLLVELCLGPSLRLPQLNLVSKGFYRLEPWHIRYFEFHREDIIAQNNRRQNRITRVLAPVFKSLNRCVSPDSIYLQHYNVDWKQLTKEIKDSSPRVNQLCDSVAHDFYSDDINYYTPGFRNSGVVSHGEINKQVIISEMAAIRFRLAPFLESMRSQLQRSCEWIGIEE